MNGPIRFEPRPPRFGRARGLTRLAACVLIASCAGGAYAQSYPARAITIVTPNPAASTPDLVGRAIAQKLSEAWRQPVVMDNRPGGGAVIGTEVVARAAPDGYTLLLHTATHAIGPSMHKQLPYDPVKSFTPISMLAFVPNVLITHPTLPVRNVTELIALARARPGKLDYSSSGPGTPAHLAGELFRTMTGIDIVHIPYKGSTQALTAVLSGETVLMFCPVPIALAHIRSGKLKVLGVTTVKRSSVVPDLPTISETGLRGYEVTNWYGMQAPAGTPQDIVAKLNAEIRKALTMPDVVQKLVTQGAEPAPGTPEALQAHVRSEIAKWAKVVRISGALVN